MRPWFPVALALVVITTIAILPPTDSADPVEPAPNAATKMEEKGVVTDLAAAPSALPSQPSGAVRESVPSDEPDSAVQHLVGRLRAAVFAQDVERALALQRELATLRGGDDAPIEPLVAESP